MGAGADLCADNVRVGAGVSSPDGRRRQRADPILAAAAAAAAWAFRPAAAAYGGVGQQKASFSQISRAKLCLVIRLTCRPY